MTNDEQQLADIRAKVLEIHAEHPMWDGYAISRLMDVEWGMYADVDMVDQTLHEVHYQTQETP